MDEILRMYADETNKAKLRDEVEGGDKSKRTSRDNTDVLAKVSFFTNLVSLTLVPQQLGPLPNLLNNNWPIKLLPWLMPGVWP